MTLKLVPVFTCVALLLAIAVRPAAGQDTRAEIIAGREAKKATELRAYEPSGLERLLTRGERALTEMRQGFYPVFGSVYSGGGFAAGPGFRRFYGDRTFWDVESLLSIRAYKLVELNTASPGHAHGRLDLFARGGWRDATEVAFYGLGADSLKHNRSDFRMKQSYALTGVNARPVRWTIANAAIAFEDFRIGDGQGAAPSTEQVHTPQSAPGLGADPSYIHSSASAGIDWRPAAGYARRGGLYEVAYHSYIDTGTVYTFDRLDAQIVQHLPILRENWVLSVRGQVQTVLDDHDSVPYFLLPALGSGSTLRGFSSWRFRDRHSLLTSAEWRWMPNRLAFDMAIFYDAGKVVARRSDLDLNGLKSDVGVGVRFHTAAATPVRIELARSSEGLRIVFNGSAAF